MTFSLTRRSLVRGCLIAGAIVPRTLLETRSRAVAQSGPSPPLLVDASWLADQIVAASPTIQVLDLSDLRAYRSSHIPGAIHSYWLETVERDYPYFGTVLNRRNVANTADDQGKRLTWLRRHGISPDKHVVAYDRDQGRRAARIVWFLRFLGHERASLLDGGFAAWNVAEYAVTSGEQSVSALSGEPVARPRSRFYLSTNQLAQALASPETLLVDIRSEEERRDTVGGQFPTGVIPGSLHIPWNRPELSVATPDRPFDPNVARATLEQLGIGSDRRVVLYGRFGCDANLTWLVFRASGLERVEVYDRGWVEWARSGRLYEPIE